MISQYTFPQTPDDLEKHKQSNNYLRKVHQVVCDSFHINSLDKPTIFDAVVKQKSEALLMDEASMNFYSVCLNINPSPK